MAEVFVLRIRIKFSKYDTLRFVGHLDIMRYFQRLIRRADIPIRYSEGYHPHQLLSFAQPLGLGITSDGEYLDAELVSDMDVSEITKKLNENVSYGVEILETVRLSDREANKKIVTSMSLISRSLYMVILKDVSDEVSKEFSDLSVKMADAFKESGINVLKKTKKGEKEINLKDFTYEVYYSDGNDCDIKPIFVSSFCEPVLNDELIQNASKHAPDFDNGKKLYISLSAGSETNIAPDYFMESMINLCESKIQISDLRFHRMELFGGEPKGSKALCRILL